MKSKIEIEFFEFGFPYKSRAHGYFTEETAFSFYIHNDYWHLEVGKPRLNHDDRNLFFGDIEEIQFSASEEMPGYDYPELTEEAAVEVLERLFKLSNDNPEKLEKLEKAVTRIERLAEKWPKRQCPKGLEILPFLLIAVEKYLQFLKLSEEEIAVLMSEISKEAQRRKEGHYY